MSGRWGEVYPFIILPTQYYFKPGDPVSYDPEKAKALLAEAGYPNGFKTQIDYPVDTARTQMAEIIKEQLAKIGIDCTLVPQEGTAYKALWDVNNPATPSGMTIANSTMPRIDPYTQMYNNFGITSTTNFGKVNDPEFLRLLEILKVEPDSQKRKDLVWEMQDIALDTVYNKFFHVMPKMFPHRKTLHGVFFSAIGAANLRSAWSSK
jgi:peptide/nickel transport system substrate-binding protein